MTARTVHICHLQQAAASAEAVVIHLAARGHATSRVLLSSNDLLPLYEQTRVSVDGSLFVVLWCGGMTPALLRRLGEALHGLDWLAVPIDAERPRDAASWVLSVLEPARAAEVERRPP